MDLYTLIVAEEELTGETVNVKETLVALVDGYIQKRSTLTQAQKSELAVLRAKIITGLTTF